MLVLTRKAGESLFIDDIAEVLVIDIRGERVRLGITAPADVTIRRGELVPDPAAENDRSTEPPTELLEAK